MLIITLERDEDPEKPWTAHCCLCQVTTRFSDQQARWFWENDHYRTCPVLRAQRREV
jgi:hypothetical protein